MTLCFAGAVQPCPSLGRVGEVDFHAFQFSKPAETSWAKENAPVRTAGLGHIRTAGLGHKQEHLRGVVGLREADGPANAPLAQAALLLRESNNPHDLGRADCCGNENPEGPAGPHRLHTKWQG